MNLLESDTLLHLEGIYFFTFFLLATQIQSISAKYIYTSTIQYSVVFLFTFAILLGCLYWRRKKIEYISRCTILHCTFYKPVSESLPSRGDLLVYARPHHCDQTTDTEPV
jgi:hypothetical protein